MSPVQIAERLAALHRTHPTLLVAVDGAGGAGKSTLANFVAQELLGAGVLCEVIHFDDFYRPSAERQSPLVAQQVGGDFDWQRLEREVLLPLRAGQPARYARYDWGADALAEVHVVQPGQVVIVEGVYSSRLELAPLYHLTIWVDCPRDLRLERGVTRDGESHRGWWENTWMPAEDRYVQEHRPRERADIVVRGFPEP
ncbi:MAG: uridine kinase [Anaerolineales bacterium]|nr:uridine kinase [Anaerolineales bacterium]